MSMQRDTVIILGSGCSVGLDVPTLVNFLDAVFDRLGKDSDNIPKQDIIDSIEKFVQCVRSSAAYVRADLLNIEELYGLAEMMCSINESGSDEYELADHAREALNRAIYLIAFGCGRELILYDTYRELAKKDNINDIINESYTENAGDVTPNLHTTLMSYLALAHFAFETKAAVIQFNWDVAFDRAAYVYAKERNICEGYDKKIMELIYNETNCSSEDTTPDAPVILRPHGGIHCAESTHFWEFDPCYVCEMETDINYNIGIIYSNEIRTEMCQSISECTGYDDDTYECTSCGRDICYVAQSFRLSAAMCIEPPTWKKDIKRFPDQWQHMQKALKTARQIIFIGYSLPKSDLYFRHFLAMALAGNNLAPKVYVWNPSIMKEGSPERESYMDVFAPLAREGRLLGLGEKFGDPALYDLNRVMHLSSKLEP